MKSLRDSRCRPVVIVDAFSRGGVLAEAFSKQAPCVHVRSRHDMPDVFTQTFRTELFERDLALSEIGSVQVVEILRGYDPIAVIPGSEFGVEVADKLSGILGLPSNGDYLSNARRNKYQMAQVAQKAGIKIAKQLSSASLPEAIKWYCEMKGLVVVKPVDSAGSDNVFICANVAELSEAYCCIKDDVNLMMNKNVCVLLQEYISGFEYAVNTVSHSGVHWVTDIWADSKQLVQQGRRKAYDTKRLLDPCSDDVESIVRYTRQVLDALGIAYGPAHTELIVTPAGPLLLETGARISGAINPSVLKAATGTDQVEMTVHCYLNPAKMHESPTVYKRKRNACCVFLFVTTAGFLHQARIEAFLRTLPSFADVVFRLLDGSRVTPSADVSSSPGTCFLIHESKHQIEQDRLAFRAWEMTCYSGGGQ